MRAAIAVVAFMCGSVAVAVACGSDPPAGHGISGDGDGGDGGGEQTVDSSTPEGDAEGPVSPTGCPLKTTDYTAGAKADTVAKPTGNVASWTNPEGALLEDSEIATVTLNEGQ